MAGKKRSKIKYCYRDYCKTLSEDEHARYLQQYQPLVEIIMSAADDDEVLGRVRAYDEKNGTDLFAEAVNFTIYCIACHRVDCVC